MKPGIYYDLPMADYIAAPGLSSSRLKILLESPLTYRRTIQGLMPRETSPAMSMGSALHSAILEDKREFYVKPSTYGDGEKRWNANGTECRQWLADHADKPVLDQEEAEWIETASNYVRTHHTAGALLKDGRPEVSVFTEIDGRLFKARFDMIAPGRAVDLKTVTDASSRGFSRAVFKYGWHIQAALYMRIAAAAGLRLEAFYWIALQKGALPLVNVIRYGASAQLLGGEQLNRALQILDRCERDDRWPEWADDDGETHSLYVPEYLLNDTTTIEDDL